MQDIKDYTLDELKDKLTSIGFPSFCAQQIFGWIYKRKIEKFDFMTNISREIREFLKNNFYFSSLDLLKREISCDETQKFLFGLEDKNCIETVLIPEGKRNTLCVSTQVGCKFDCKFCASGKDGFRRNLSVSEILNQYLSVCACIRANKITNIVFMGVGEPLDNFSNTVKAAKMLTDPRGIHFGRRRICISTCGLIPQIEKLKELNLGIKLSISLHSPEDNLRSQLMPINRKYPLSELMKTIKNFSNKSTLPITFEYILIKGLNTSKTDADKLAKLLRGLNYKINLIPFNRFAEISAYIAESGPSAQFSPPSLEEINNFKNELKRKGVFFTLRKPKGQDINAACGQLRAKYK